MSLPRVKNALTRLLDIQVPVVCAPMAKVGTPEMTAQVTLAGGYSFIASGYGSPQSLRNDIHTAQSILSSAGHLKENAQLPFGVAYFGWEIQRKGDEWAREMIDVSLDNNVQSIWLLFEHSLGRWVEYIRQKDQQSPHTRKTVMFVLVNSIAEALKAVNEWKSDVIVAQGIESGGHGSSRSPPTFSLVSSILAALPQTQSRPLVLAAGGLSNGGQAASFLTLGADGAVFGTRFILSHESRYSAAQKAALLAADSNATVRSFGFDIARGTTEWPEGIDGRALRNSIFKDFDGGLDAAALRARFLEKSGSGDLDYTVTWSGTGVGEMRDLKGAKDITHHLHAQLVHRLRESRTFLPDAPSFASL